MLAPYRAEELAALPGVAHGFFTRQGGVSGGIYTALNCGLGSGDDPAAVHENRARVSATLGAAAVVTVHQVHSADAIFAEKAWAHADRPKADAIVTGTPGLAVGALSADCAPVLFADPRAKLVAAAHAGWRGAVGGILEATIALMLKLGARREHIVAAVGPCIGPRIYEVGPDFHRDVLARDAQAAPFFHVPETSRRAHFDLPGYAQARLQRAEINVAAATPPCTFEQHQLFFSFRRSQVEKAADYGRQISAIVLT